MSLYYEEYESMFLKVVKQYPEVIYRQTHPGRSTSRKQQDKIVLFFDKLEANILKQTGSARILRNRHDFFGKSHDTAEFAGERASDSGGTMWGLRLSRMRREFT